MFKENIALKYWGRKLSGSPSEEEEIQEIMDRGQNRAYAKSFVKAKNIKIDASRMNPITPAITVFISYLNIFIFFSFTILGFFVFKWYIIIPISILAWFLSGFLAKLFPKENSSFWYNRFYKGLMSKRKIYFKNNDYEKASACDYFIERMEEFKY